jgi:glucose-6-phosphate 1-dehydrogenase
MRQDIINRTGQLPFLDVKYDNAILGITKINDVAMVCYSTSQVIAILADEIGIEDAVEHVAFDLSQSKDGLKVLWIEDFIDTMNIDHNSTDSKEAYERLMKDLVNGD